MKNSISIKAFAVTLILLVIFVLSMSGCSQNNESESNNIEVDSANDSTVETDDLEETTLPESTDTVPGTGIAVFPGANLEYHDDAFAVYSTDASIDDLYDYYIGFPEFSSVHGSRALDHLAFLETELVSHLRGLGPALEDDEAYNEWEKEKDSLISSPAGNTLFFVAMQEGSQELNPGPAGLTDEMWSQLPMDSNIFYFGFFNE